MPATPMMSNVLVFQYGSNMSTARLNAPQRLAGNARVLGIAITDKSFELIFDVWSNGSKCAAADIQEGTGRRVWGVVYEIPARLIQRQTSDPLRSLDAIEGEGTNYRRTEIALRWRNGRRVRQPVITYVGFSRMGRILTSAEYVSHILTGIAEHSLPKGYLSYARAQILANNPKLNLDR